MASAIALIPADRARIVVPEEPDEFVVKHTDGELMRISAPPFPDDPSEGRVWEIEVRQTADVSWFPSSHGRTLHDAVVNLADLQGLNVRANDESSNIVRETRQGHVPTTDLEIELLDRAALIVDHDRHLPVIVRTGESEYWRVRHSHGPLRDHPTAVKELVDEDIRARGPVGPVYIVERSDGMLPSDEWEPVDAIAGTDANPMYAADCLANRAGIPTSDVETEAIRDTFDDLDMEFGDIDIGAKEEMMGVAQSTVTFGGAHEE